MIENALLEWSLLLIHETLLYGLWHRLLLSEGYHGECFLSWLLNLQLRLYLLSLDDVLP